MQDADEERELSADVRGIKDQGRRLCQIGSCTEQEDYRLKTAVNNSYPIFTTSDREARTWIVLQLRASRASMVVLPIAKGPKAR
jgi:hypothetical protein